MADRLALLIDSDESFANILASSLAPYGFSVTAIAELKDVKQHQAELLFIAVELPDKAGYALCNKAKKGVAKTIPVVLATASVPPEDLDKHRKLKVHADAYMDKRSVTPEEILQKVGGLLELGPAQASDEGITLDADEFDMDEMELEIDDDDAVELEVEEVDFAEIEAEEIDAGELGAEQFDDEATRVSASMFPEGTGGRMDADVNAAFDTAAPAPEVVEAALPPAVELPPVVDLGLDEVAQQAGAEAPSYGNDSNNAELEAEVERLTTELEAARKSGGAADFSRDREFLNLREKINKKEKESITLREELDQREQEILVHKKKVREFEKVTQDTEGKLLDIEGDIVEKNEQAAALIQETEAAKQRVAQEQQSHQQTREQNDARMVTLEQDHQGALQRAEETKIDALAQLQTQMEEQQAQALAVQKSENADATETLQNEHAEQLVGVKAEYADLEERKDRELKVAERRLEDAKDAALVELAERLEGEQTAALEAAESQRQTDVAAETQRSADEKTALEQSHGQRVAELQVEIEALQDSINSAKAMIGELQEEIASARNTIGDKERDIAGYQRDVADRDDRITEFKNNIQELETQSAGFQEQVLQAYQRIKTDEATVSKAKKAMAIALTLLDEELGGDGAAATDG